RSRRAWCLMPWMPARATRATTPLPSRSPLPSPRHGQRTPWNRCAPWPTFWHPARSRWMPRASPPASAPAARGRSACRSCWPCWWPWAAPASRTAALRRPEPGGLASGARAGDLRITAVAALAWRAMTEIVRRRHPGHHFDLLQLHPGISTAGLIRLGLQPRDGGQPLRVDFHLGGPDPGSWQTPDGIGGPLLALLGREPVAAIDAIE